MSKNSRTDSLLQTDDANWLKRFRLRCLQWYRQHARALPWRSTQDAYAIWVSEVMLQQTQVATVIPYFVRFLARFPDPATLAAAEEKEVFQYWEGLGYYRRAKQMHRAAMAIVETHDGVFPQDFESINALPGIGRYTAGAISSFAFDGRHPIVEANTQRLYARLVAIEGDLSTRENQQRLWEFATRVLPKAGSGELNQSMMEIGSQICKPKEPDCSSCPLKELCRTCQQGLQNEIPAPKAKKRYEERTEVLILLRNTKSQWLLRRCGPGEWWTGLWDFPRFDVTAVPQEAVGQHVHRLCAERFGRGCQLGAHVRTLRHGVTRYRITLHCHHSTWSPRGKANWKSDQMAWVETSALQDFALNSTARKIAHWLSKELGASKD